MPCFDQLAADETHDEEACSRNCLFSGAVRSWMSENWLRMFRDVDYSNLKLG